MRHLRLGRVILAALWGTSAFGQNAIHPAGQESMPRVGVREGRFVELDTGRTITPRGFNYIRLLDCRHGTFAPGTYDGARASRMLEHLRQRGFNIVRVFLDFRVGTGAADSGEAGELSAAYLNNVVDFLERAWAARVYVVLCAVHVPPAQRYRSVAPPHHTDTAGLNRFYLDEAMVRAKAAYLTDLATAIQRRDPGLLPAVWAYELENEACFHDRQRPFDRREGEFRGPGGKTYRLDDGPELQELMDDAIVAWADTCVDALHAVDPLAMVTVSAFTPQAVGLRGPGRLRPLSAHGGERRVPARLLALTRSRLSYLDLHLYPLEERTLEKDLASVEWERLREACRQRGLPLVMGEFGAFKSAYPELGEATKAVEHHLRQVMKLGFAGYLYWTYDTDEQPNLWNALSGDGMILEALVRFNSGEP